MCLFCLLKIEPYFISPCLFIHVVVQGLQGVRKCGHLGEFFRHSKLPHRKTIMRFLKGEFLKIIIRRNVSRQ